MRVVSFTLRPLYTRDMRLLWPIRGLHSVKQKQLLEVPGIE
jgi:hypothetical protein